ncbi:MAG: Uncharacterized protein CEN90_120 [Parcubacteria group bacterium Licking1014_17]|nr:MAG: Uncharacterized protein CEN90_120 [Parcubacteria group bacterium Licking1014_17]
MPQIFLKIAPIAQSAMTKKIIAVLDSELSRLVVKIWDVPKRDTAFTAEHACYARGEAELQFEVRYTAGKDEYGKGSPFDPTEEEQDKLSELMEERAREVLAKEGIGFTVSVWPKPQYNSTFRASTTMSCKVARRKIKSYFKERRDEPLDDALYNHMTIGSSVVGKHHVSCKSCWEYYTAMKRKHCGG